MSAGVWSCPCSLTERMLSSAEERLLKDMVDVQLMALFTKDLSHAPKQQFMSCFVNIGWLPHSGRWNSLACQQCSLSNSRCKAAI